MRQSQLYTSSHWLQFTNIESLCRTLVEFWLTCVYHESYLRPPYLWRVQCALLACRKSWGKCQNWYVSIPVTDKIPLMGKINGNIFRWHLWTCLKNCQFSKTAVVGFSSPLSSLASMRPGTKGLEYILFPLVIWGHASTLCFVKLSLVLPCSYTHEHEHQCVWGLIFFFF